VEGVLVRVATPRTLCRMKRGTVRPIDHADALALRFAFDPKGGRRADMEYVRANLAGKQAGAGIPKWQGSCYEPRDAA
jgi:hypothetical protein